MAYTRQHTAMYRFAKADLGPSARIQLRFAELLIAADPYGQPSSYRLALGGKLVTMTDFGDLAVFYEVTDAETVSFHLVLDARHLPDWFTAPAGTWFEGELE